MTETREQLLEEIRLQGDLVRQFKAKKEPKEKVSRRISFYMIHSKTRANLQQQSVTSFENCVRAHFLRLCVRAISNFALSLLYLTHLPVVESESGKNRF